MNTAFPRPVFFLLFFLIPSVGWAQQHASQPEEAHQLLQKADSLQHAARYDSSTTYYQKAASLFEKTGNLKKQRQIWFQISKNKLAQDEREASASFLEKGWSLSTEYFPNDNLFRLRYYHQKGVLSETEGSYQKAMDWYKKGMSLAHSTDHSTEIEIMLYAGIGEVYLSQGKYDKAVEQLSDAQNLYHQNQLENNQLLSRIYTARGETHLRLGEYETALIYFELALETNQQNLPHPHPDLSKTQNNLALVYYYQGDYQRALEYMRNATNVLASFHGQYHRLVAVGYNNIGIVYSEIGKLQQAVEYLKKSIRIRENILRSDHPDIAIGYQNLGAIYSDMEEYDQAIEQYQKAKELFRDRFPDGHPELANIYANLGEAYGEKKEYDKALDFYFKDLEINERMLSADHPFIGDTFSKVGYIYTQMGNYDQALEYFERSLEVLINNYSLENPFQDLSLSDTPYPELLLTTLQFKADALHQQAEENGRQRQLDLALQTYLQTVTFIDDLQQSLNREESKFYLRERTADIYEEGFNVALKLLKDSGNTDYQNHLFYFAQKSRNQILLEQVQKLGNQKFARIPDSLISREQDLRSQVSRWQQQLSRMTSREATADSLERMAVQDSLFHSKRQLQNYIQYLEESYPEYYGLKFQPPVTTIEEVQQNILVPGQSMISYFFSDESLFAMVLSSDTFEVVELPADSTLTDQISQYRSGITGDANIASFSRQGHDLYKQFIAPLSDIIAGPKLLIIPDGPLHYLPFESLITNLPADSENLRPRDLSYLITSYAINYASSVGLLELQQQSETDYSKAFLGIAPTFNHVSPSNQRVLYPDYNRPVSPLLFNKREVQKLEKLYNQREGLLSFLRSAKNNGDTVIGEDATETRFKEINLNKYRVIHLATHAFLNEEHPEQSGILFSAPDDREDGTLHAAEIYHLNLSAELVALSACNTGTGTLAKGEGIMGLSRAFQYAGAQNLLISLWEVDDRSTEQLMINFYKQKEQKKHPAEALRQAKLSMINNSQYKHPKYWAPFIYLGQ